jgi:hypothetical protein
MMATMMLRKERPDRVEMFLYGFVVAITAWPLAQLLITLAETANG